MLPGIDSLRWTDRDRCKAVTWIVSLAIIASCSSAARAGEWFEECGESDWLTRDRLLGDVGGVRPAAAEHGVDAWTEATLFYQGTTSGGRQQAFQFGGRNDYFAKVDGEKAFGRQGLFLDIHGETRYGEDVSGLTGAIVPSTMAMNLPAPGETISGLTGFKVTQAFSESFAVFGGKLNLLDGYLLNYGSGRGVDRFQNGALVFNTALARTAPYSSLGFGAVVLDEGEPVLTLLVLDAVNHSTNSVLDDPFDQGAVILGEGRVRTSFFGKPGHQIVGATWSSRQYTSIADTPLLLLPPEVKAVPGRESGSWSFYYNFDQTLWVNEDDPTRTFGVFGQTGIADDSTSPLEWTISFGVSGNVPWEVRPQDEFGVGYYYLEGSSDLRDSLAPFVTLGDGQGVELFYKINATKWMAITPSIQWIQSGIEAFDDAVVVGLRGKLTF
ncbi:MAG: carbohydrate porin [Planctomycetaceae bacterium]|nr:carbohydrate porin [Planctomycetaceae bacterium]